jgi:hypothetical protein
MTSTLSFPAKQSDFRTRIALRKYSRPKPGSPVQITMDNVIVLPLPVALQDSFNIEVANPAMDLLGNDFAQTLQAGKSATEEIVKDLKGGQSAISKMGEITLQALALTPGISDTGISRLAQATAGVVRNPHLTTIFEGVKLKTYQFTWKLAPQSAAEAKTLNSIITTLKSLMHPQLAAGGFALEYPYLASVEFTNINDAIAPNVRDSFITGMQINGGGTGPLAFYKDGQPVAIDLSLSFQEINIQTRDDFNGLGKQTGSGGVSTSLVTSPSRSSDGNFGSQVMNSSPIAGYD